MEACPRVRVVEDTAAELVVEAGRAVGVVGTSGSHYPAKAVVICSGTFLSGLMHIGMESFVGGRADEPSAETLSASLARAGLALGRLKTGTPPRVDGRTIDYSAMERQDGDDPPPLFSFSAPPREVRQVPCWLTRTLPETHEAIRGGLDRSPLFTGRIQGVGPRYCPSIEDKVVRFPERPRHQVFIEPEGLDTDEVYVNGFATSLPTDVQLAAMHSIPGMEDAEIVRWGYAVEYDFVPPQQLFASLETKAVKGLFLAGQINGTSGYEEAAGQGLMAGINAARSIQGLDPIVLGRDEAYIGVMIDDLVTKGTDDPYRLFTSRAEHRLLLRQDNADMRLADIAHRAGAISKEVWAERTDRRHRIFGVVDAFAATRITPAEGNAILTERGTMPISESQRADQVLRRPEVRLEDVEAMSEAVSKALDGADEGIRWQVETEIKYSGYLERQRAAVARQRELEDKPIPEGFPFAEVKELSAEARQKLSKVRPMSLGQALRVPGVRAADVAVLAVALEKRRRMQSQTQEEPARALDA